MAEAAPLRVRPATLADVEALTHLHCTCFRPEDHVPVMLGRPYVRATYRWQVGNRRSYVLLCESADRLAGLVSVCDGPYLRPMFLACLPQFVWSLVRHPSLMLNKALWGRLTRRPSGVSHEPDHSCTAHLMNVAVHPEFRGTGAFRELMAAAERESRARGAQAIRTGVYKSNTASRRAFSKVGWSEVPALGTHDTICTMVQLDSPS